MIWKRVTKARKCSVCHHDTWCIYTHDAEICMRVASAKEVKCGGAGRGWLHTSGTPRTEKPYEPPPERPTPAMNWDSFVRTTVRDVDLSAMSADLNLPPEPLVALDMGWSYRFGAATFPMRDGSGTIIGIRLRSRDGKKWAVPGSKNGLFIPAAPMSSPVIVCEGPTDTAALLSVGLFAVGRPSCNACTDMVVAFADVEQVSSVLVIADRDKPGSAAERNTLDAARELTVRLERNRVRAKVIRPPCKDAREWVARGATARTIARCAECAI